ncbi:hypothetical protein BDV28DRAFT_145599 [Aspergillus coremiiformis]|uniref:Uncharacterized protein n=1 Tax=Aspergillus coremiiformis TaxID=138285 RepID=A0A5N6ZE59_9EURO|nr:hypothetical protein BDV28DRAFT_145599 [Aspergillus coremiiformis]
MSAQGPTPEQPKPRWWIRAARALPNFAEIVVAYTKEADANLNSPVPSHYRKELIGYYFALDAHKGLTGVHLDIPKPPTSLTALAALEKYKENVPKKIPRHATCPSEDIPVDKVRVGVMVDEDFSYVDVAEYSASFRTSRGRVSFFGEFPPVVEFYGKSLVPLCDKIINKLREMEGGSEILLPIRFGKHYVYQLDRPMRDPPEDCFPENLDAIATVIRDE